jgi:hypothetical protein
MNAMVRRGEIVDAARSKNASMLEDIRNSGFGEQTQVDIFKKVVGVGHVVFVLDNSSFWPGKIWDKVRLICSFLRNLNLCFPLTRIGGI